jgi:hypothetical protein
MENNKHKEKNETYDMNMIINEPPNNILKWSHILNNIQNKSPNELTPKIVHPFTNMNHIHSDHDLQQLELRHIPTTKINQSNNPCTNMESVESIYDNIYSPTLIQKSIKK